MSEASAGETAVRMEGVEETVRSVLDQLALLPNVPTLSPDIDLYEAGMTSHASVKFMLALEDAFDLEFPDDMLKRETFSSIAVIRDSIQRLLGSA